MNDRDRSELEWLKQRHARLEQDLSTLARQLKSIESRLQAHGPPAPAPPSPKAASSPASPPPIAQPPPPAAPTPGPAPEAPPLIPPIISTRKQEPVAPREAASEPPPAAPAPAAGGDAPKFIRCLCQHCGGHLEFAAVLVGDTVRCPHCGRTTFLAMETKPPVNPPPEPPPVLPPLPQPAAPAVAPEPAVERSLEMRFGRHWAPRIGIVMVLTAFVFFANYAYQNFHLGAIGRVALLYLGSSLLMAAGAWWQRKAANALLKNYAQVLFAGGLAAVYFTTYAAHHIDKLRVIADPLVDGALLLAWAGFMVWLADRKKSEILALFAVGLAYYTSVITRVGSFTLYSNLLLTVAAVFFLIRNRWAGLTFASLVATYASYAFWRFFEGSHWHWTDPAQGLWHGTYFLVSYWIVFTAAVFLSRHPAFAGPNRATFLTLNNGGFFALFLLTMLQVHQEGFWKFALIYGAVLLVLTEAARRLLTAETLSKNAYLTQGLVLVTAGLVSHPRLAGLQLALWLGAESVVLLTLGFARRSPILQTGAGISGAMAIGWGIDGLTRDDRHGLYLGSALGAMMAFNAFWAHRRGLENRSVVRPVPAFFTVLALIGWLATTWYNNSPANFPLALALQALALTVSIYLVGVREFVVFGQGYLLLAQCAWLVHFVSPEQRPPWWNAAAMVVITFALSHWWQRQKVLRVDPPLASFWQAAYGLVIVGLLYYWLQPLVSASSWLALSSALAVGLTAYAALTRAWWLAAFGQIFILISAVQFALRLLPDDKPEWYVPLAPVAALGLLSFSTVLWFERRPQANAVIREPLLQIAMFYRWTGLVLSLWWIREYVPAQERIWVLLAIGLVIFLWAGWRRSAEALVFSGAYAAFGFILLWWPVHRYSTAYVPNALALAAWLAQAEIARRLPDRYRLDRRLSSGMVALGGLTLWLLLYRWLHESAVTRFYMTAGWSVLALVFFVCGMALRERMYRWLGLAVLGGALGRVFVFDVWKLGTLYRILSFLALGIALLVLGFLYNRYQEKIKEWL